MPNFFLGHGSPKDPIVPIVVGKQARDLQEKNTYR